MIQTNTPEIKFALDAVRQAALLVRYIQSELVSETITKPDFSPVTVADFAAQALVARQLASAFPNLALVAEEDTQELRKPESASALESITGFVSAGLRSQVTPDAVCQWIDHNRADPSEVSQFWTLDPIDGTKGFLRGDQYAIALALVDHGQVQVAALACPSLVDAYRPDQEGNGSLVIAARGQGCWVTDLTGPGDFHPLKVSTRANPADTRILRSFESGHTNVTQIDLFSQALGVQVEPVLMDSQAKYAVLAAGKGDLLLRLLSASQPNYREKIWDQAAGSLVLEEAGGVITDLDGQPLDFTTGRSLTRNRGILATNGPLHSAALEALRLIGA